MRIVLFGQAAFAQQVLDGLRERGHDVAAVYCPPAAKPDPLAARARELDLPVHEHVSLKRPDVAGEVAAYAADLGVLAYVTQIVPPAVFEAPRLGSICFHPSLLPRYRGGSAIPWQIIRGESETGVTVFWVDPGIDTGAIVLQRRAPLGPDETAASLYYNTLFPLGVSAVLEAVELIAAGAAPRHVQDEAQATYDPLCRDAHAHVDWARPVAEVYNLIRGCDPQPGAFVLHSGAPLRLFDARRVAAPGTAPGVIAAIAPEGIVVGVAGGAISIGRLKAGAEKKVTAAEAATALGLEIGGRIGDA
jgi:methionyl-tRNA formyltransferase